MTWPHVTLACVGVITWGVVMVVAIKRDAMLGFCIAIATTIGGCVVFAK